MVKGDYQVAIWNQLLYKTVDIVTPINKKDDVYSYIGKYACRPPPLFIILISLAEICVFTGYAVYDGTTNCPGCLDKSGNVGILVFDPTVREQVWRYISYTLIHESIHHITSNMIVQLVLGIPLELVHKFWRVGPLYLCGVIMAALVQSSVDPYVLLLGASGGAMALLAAHVANLALNWSEMKGRWIHLILIVSYVTGCIGRILFRRFSGRCKEISYAGHVGGVLAGLLLGFILLRNFNASKWEKVLQWVGLFVFVCIFIAFVCLSILWPADKPEFEVTSFKNSSNN